MPYAGCLVETCYINAFTFLHDGFLPQPFYLPLMACQNDTALAKRSVVIRGAPQPVHVTQAGLHTAKTIHAAVVFQPGADIRCQLCFAHKPFAQSASGLYADIAHANAAKARGSEKACFALCLKNHRQGQWHPFLCILWKIEQGRICLR